MVYIAQEVLVMLIGGYDRKKEGRCVHPGRQFHRPGITTVKIYFKRERKKNPFAHDLPIFF